MNRAAWRPTGSGACSKTPAGGRIELAVSWPNGQVAVIVRDNSIGIPAEMQPRIFERFFRADAARGHLGAQYGRGRHGF